MAENIDIPLHKEEDQTQRNFGYFTTLRSKFTSTQQQIEKNYQKLIRYYGDSDLNLENKQEIMNKINQAYSIIKDQQLREEYMHNLTIRSYLSQPIELQVNSNSKKEINKLFPFFIYEVFKEGNKESNILQFDFVNQTVKESQKEIKIKSFNFSNISSALYSKKEDEFIINFIDNGKILSQNYKAKFQTQRDYIVKLAILAKEIFEESKPTLEFHNPNTKQDMTLFKIQHFSIGDNSKTFNCKVSNLFFDQTSTKNYFLWNDSIIPHASIFRGVAIKQKKFGKCKPTHFVVGKSQILLARDEEVKQITQIIPLRKEYLAFIKDRNQTISLQVLNKTRKYKFTDSKQASLFLHSVMTILNQKVNMPNIIVNFPFNDSKENLSQLQKQKLNQLNSKIKEIENQLQVEKEKKQLLLKELSEWDIDIDKLDEDALHLQLQQKNQQQEKEKYHTIYQIPIKEENQFL